MKMNKKDYLIIASITLIIFASTYTVLSILGFLPKEFKYVEINEPSKNDYLEEKGEEDILYPEKITISKIGVESVIQQPQSQDVAILDEALLKGAVYYPGSGTINVGNMFIFGHSADRFVGVTNPAFKVFNNVEKLEIGDEIKIESKGRIFIYKVQEVSLVDENTALVEFNKTNKTLTITTCNTFGKAEDRWVVEAEFDREV